MHRPDAQFDYFGGTRFLVAEIVFQHLGFVGAVDRRRILVEMIVHGSRIVLGTRRRGQPVHGPTVPEVV